MRMTTTHNTVVGVASGVIGILLAVHAGAADFQKQCRALSAQDLATAANAAEKIAEMTQKENQELRVFSGGKPTLFEFAAVAPKGTVYCARLARSDRHVNVINATPTPGDQPKSTLLLLEMPRSAWGDPLRQQEELLVVGLPATEDGSKLNKDAPKLAARQDIGVGNSLACGVIALVGVLVAYLVAVFALGKVNAGGHLNFLHPWPGQIPPGVGRTE